MTTPWSKTHKGEQHTLRKYEDGDISWKNWTQQIFVADESHKCPTYVNRTPPCQGSCPSGEDIRGWLLIAHAFRRSTDANPFPSQMGRVCPAPCEAGCNRNEVDDFVGINAVEQYIGDTATENGFSFESAPLTSDKRIAIVGGGPAGMAAAYQLRRKGYASTIFDDHDALGGMMRFGIPGYRTPREHLDAEIDRILALGDIEVKLGVRVGEDISIETLEKDYDALTKAICMLPVTKWCVLVVVIPPLTLYRWPGALVRSTSSMRRNAPSWLCMAMWPMILPWPHRVVEPRLH